MVISFFLLLILGLVQSIFELIKDDDKNKKWNIKRILSLVYILTFFLGLINLFFQNKESKKFNDLVTDMSSSVNNIDSMIESQLKIFNKSINQSKTLLNKSDSLQKTMLNVMKTNDTLISQYFVINKKLSNQIELDNKQLAERAPIIGIYDFDNSLEGSDSTSYSIRVCLRNIGKRTALVHSGIGVVLFYNKTNQLIYVLEIPGNTLKSNLEQNDINQIRYCFLSYGIQNFNILKKQSTYAVICLKIRHEDVIQNIDTTEYFYN